MTLEPDVLGRSVPGEAEVEGEKRLCLALLQDALELALGKIPARPRERNEALAWIRSDEESPFGFGRVCSELGLDPREIRRKVEARLSGAATPEPAILSGNGNGELQALGEQEAPPPGPSPAPRKPRHPRRRPRRIPCPICRKALEGPWRETLRWAVPLGTDTRAVGTVAFRLCTGCVTLFVEGRFVGEVRFGSRL